jgi:hypothetical protein
MPTAREEAQQILTLVRGDAPAAYDLVERQLSVLVMRTQVMLSLSGIVVTVTGFSGRAIADTSQLARLSISAGILVVLASAATAIGGVLKLRWMTQELGSDDITDMLARTIVVRDKKARFLALSLSLFIVGFGLYCFAIAQLLLAARPAT